MGSMEIGLDQFYNHISWIGGFYESMDRFVCRFANCLDYRVHTVFHVAGGLIHLLLIFAVISLILHFVMGARTA